MGPALALATVAAVLGAGEVVFVQVERRAVVARVPLPEPGAGIFAPPDGSALVPLARREATALVRPDGSVKVAPGRLFPLFFDEFDRMFVAMPGQLALLAYPQRVAILQVPLPEVQETYHASVTTDGMAVALVGGAEHGLGVWVVPAGGQARRLSVACPPRQVALAPRGEWLAVACASGEVVVTFLDGRRGELLPLRGEITGMVADELGRNLLVAVAAPGGGGFLVGIAVRPDRALAVKERWRSSLRRSPRALATCRGTVLVVDEAGVTQWEGGGRRLVGEIPAAGGTAVVVLRETAGLPPSWWGEGEATPKF